MCTMRDLPSLMADRAEPGSNSPSRRQSGTFGAHAPRAGGGGGIAYTMCTDKDKMCTHRVVTLSNTLFLWLTV